MEPMRADTPNYFIMRPEVSDEYCAIFRFPDGMRDIYKPAEGVRMGTSYREGLRFRMAKEERGLKIPDVIPNALGYFMVSARMKQLLGHSGAEIEFLRFTLLNHRGRVANNDCYIANVIGLLDCVDMKRSDGDLGVVEPDRFMYLRRLVLRESKIPRSAKLFRPFALPSVIVVRRDLKEIFENEGVTGPTYYATGSEVAFSV